MNIYLARQPIFNRKQIVVGYELLHRSSSTNQFMGIDGDVATSELISNAFLDIGIDNVTGGKKAFINFTKKLLEDETVLCLPKSSIAVEILEDIEADSSALDACKRLKQLGYTLVLDDYAFEKKHEGFLDHVDIVKVDLQRVKELNKIKMMSVFTGRGNRMLAEKVETIDDYNLVMESGFDLMQGYFFCKPVILESKSMPSNKLQCMRLMHEIYKPRMDFDLVERLIKEDASISYKLLRYINTLAFPTRFQISSIRQSMALLGQKEMIKWSSLVCLYTFSSDKPYELLVNAVTRASFCESIAVAANLKDKSSDYFITGLFSLLDTFLDKPMNEILDELPLLDDIKSALLLVPNEYRKSLEIFLQYERGNFDHAVKLASKYFGLDQLAVTKSYLSAIKMADISFQA